MSHFLDQLKQAFLENPNLSRKVLLAVSGGKDSVALLRGMNQLCDQFFWQLEVAHFNHQLRGEESRGDEIWVRELCESLQIPCHVGQRTTSSEGTAFSSEEDLRKDRYRFLLQMAEERELGLICQAHHAQDQVETILHRLLRGTGLSGLTGIPVFRPLSESVMLFRPLLKIVPESIEEYLDSLGQEYRVDSSNKQLDYTRNRIRHELLPFLSQIHPSAKNHLLNLNAQIQEMVSWQESLVAQLLKQAVLWKDSQTIRLSRNVLLEAHPILIRESFLALWKSQNWPRQKMTRRHWQSLERFLHEPASRLQLPGKVTAEKRGEMLVISRFESVMPQPIMPRDGQTDDPALRG